MLDLFVWIFAFVGALVMTGMIRAYAVRQCLLDIPNHRSSHAVPTPRGGGLAMVIAFGAGLAALFFWQRLELAVLLALGMGGVMVAGIGVVDDCGHVGPGWRILVHCLAIALGLYWLGGLPAQVVAGWGLSVAEVNLLALFLLVWLLNLFNFMDGIDGLAAMEAVSVVAGAGLIICLQGAGRWGQEVGLLGLLAAVCLGFLVWNWPPAKIFMGDVGSGFLGYVLGLLALLSMRSGLLSLPVWLILLGAFLADATVTLAARMAGGERWYEAHCSHAYQAAARRCGSHKQVTLAVLAINTCWLLPLAIGAARFPPLAWLLTLIALAPLVALVLRERQERL